MNTLNGKICLVTGATGFLGGRRIMKLSNEGAKVRALARSLNRDSYIRHLPNVEVIQGNITDFERMKTTVQGCDYVFHLAAALSGKLKYQYTVNVDGTQNVVRAAAVANIKRFVHMSSIAVYGFQHYSDITEETPHNPNRDPYNITKAQAENALVEAAKKHHMAYTIIRAGMIYGPRSHFWTYEWFKRVRNNPTIFIGDGSGYCPVIHVDDVVNLTVLAATHPNAENQIFNATPDPSPTWRDFLSSYASLVGHQNWLGVSPLLVRPVIYLLEGLFSLRGEPKDLPHLLTFIQQNLTYRMDKAHQLLNWQPDILLEEGIQTCIPYLQEMGVLD